MYPIFIYALYIYAICFLSAVAKFWRINTNIPGFFLVPSQSVFRDFPGGSDSKESTCNEEDLSSIPG